MAIFYTLAKMTDSGELAARMRRIDADTSAWARAAFAAGRKAGFLALALEPPWVFVRAYLWRGGLLRGASGLSASLFDAYTAGIGLAKLFELERQSDSRG